MPKGVEHKMKKVAVAAAATVRIPMMPKGVEHRIRQRRDWKIKSCGVRIPMMPKGVEHFLSRLSG